MLLCVCLLLAFGPSPLILRLLPLFFQQTVDINMVHLKGGDGGQGNKSSRRRKEGGACQQRRHFSHQRQVLFGDGAIMALLKSFWKRLLSPSSFLDKDEIVSETEELEQADRQQATWDICQGLFAQEGTGVKITFPREPSEMVLELVQDKRGPGAHRCALTQKCTSKKLAAAKMNAAGSRLQDMDTDLQGLRQPASKGEPRLVSAEHCTPKRGGVPSSLHFPSLPAAVGWTQHLVSRKLGFIFPMSIPLLGPLAGSQLPHPEEEQHSSRVAGDISATDAAVGVAHSCFALVKKEWGIMPLVGSDPPCPGLAGATSEVEGQSCPVVCLMLRVPTVTRADTRVLRNFSTQRASKQQPGVECKDRLRTYCHPAMNCPEMKLLLGRKTEECQRCEGTSLSVSLMGPGELYGRQLKNHTEASQEGEVGFCCTSLRIIKQDSLNLDLKSQRCVKLISITDKGGITHVGLSAVEDLGQDHSGGGGEHSAALQCPCLRLREPAGDGCSLRPAGHPKWRRSWSDVADVASSSVHSLWSLHIAATRPPGDTPGGRATWQCLQMDSEELRALFRQVLVSRRQERIFWVCRGRRRLQLPISSILQDWCLSSSPSAGVDVCTHGSATV
ncbi:hypothetical protein Anapl_01607 [Anas platyrhynchos]|uniref:Uncharacterized protein n=1 Tax=Anas platyrhynchos TaxID=8839 RepID=R0JZF1_ANAPL|nr:hypothetical protein Anapl_01607 [Anas platyrhynchos]